MLEFEDEMKAVKKGYVVLSIDEYDDLRDQLAAANMKAYEAEQLANRRIAEVTAKSQSFIDSLLDVTKKAYGRKNIEIVLNRHAIYKLAIEKLYSTFSEEELAGYVVNSANDMIMCDETLATRAAAPTNE